jgi:hypothetical protein
VSVGYTVAYTLHAFVEHITLSPRTYMQFHNQERQLVSLCEIQKKNKKCRMQFHKNVMQLERAPRESAY